MPPKPHSHQPSRASAASPVSTLSDFLPSGSHSAPSRRIRPRGSACLTSLPNGLERVSPRARAIFGSRPSAFYGSEKFLDRCTKFY